MNKVFDIVAEHSVLKHIQNGKNIWLKLLLRITIKEMFYIIVMFIFLKFKNNIF